MTPPMRVGPIAVAAAAAAATLILLLILADGRPPGASAASFTVDTTTDAADANPGDGICDSGGGHCTLRAAIMEANALPGPDTITLPPGTYTLTTGDLKASSEVTLTGAGAGTTIIDAGGVDRAINVSAGGKLTVARVTIQGGQTSGAGGGILTIGDLTVNDSVFRNNTADSGGAIASSGRLTVDRTAFIGNTGDGGGLFLAGGGSTATIRDSTVSGNTAITYSGGIHIQGGANVTLTNVTISGNSSPEPAAMTVTSDAVATLTNVTIAANISTSALHGSVANFATMQLQNTIIQDDDRSCYGGGTFQSLGHNIDSDGSCGLTGPGDMPSTDPLLGPLAGNGGPTDTMALLPGSPAIDAGGNTGCPATDQRGYSRPADGDGDTIAVCDIGAFELGAAAPSPTPSATPPAFKKGDMDCSGDVDAVDALRILRHVAGLDPNLPPGCAPIGPADTFAKGDMDCSGDVDAVDALRILRHVAGLSVTLPPGCPEIGS